MIEMLFCALLACDAAAEIYLDYLRSDHAVRR